MISIAGGWQNSRSRAWRTCLSSVLSFTESTPISPLPVQDFRRKRSACRSSKEQRGQTDITEDSFFSYTGFYCGGRQIPEGCHSGGSVRPTVGSSGILLKTKKDPRQAGMTEC